LLVLGTQAILAAADRAAVAVVLRRLQRALVALVAIQARAAAAAGRRSRPVLRLRAALAVGEL
jgi:hypothetical protein